jgi:hypothetical protein
MSRSIKSRSGAFEPREKKMTAIDRRTLLRTILPGALATVGIATIGLTLAPKAAEAVPLAVDKLGAAKTLDPVEKAQVVVVDKKHRGPRRRRRDFHRRRRRRDCFWRRGRKVCVYR